MSTEHKTAFPLCWPDGWPRIARHQRRPSAFIVGSFPKRRRSIEEARVVLADELDRLGAREAILSTNLKLRVDGLQASGQAQPDDVGAAVYFTLKGKAVSMACDKWQHVQCNIYAIAKHIESLRGQARWGVGNVDQAFRGYMALPAPGQSSGDRPWEVLGVPINAGEDQILAAYRSLAKKFHPDNPETGDAVEFNRIRNACDLMTQNLPKKP